MDIGPPELLIILVIVLLVFGGKKIPEIARGLGAASREYRKALSDEEPKDSASSTPATPATPSES
jgi:sec-independent protein translocase protein TatA